MPEFHSRIHTFLMGNKRDDDDDVVMHDCVVLRRDSFDSISNRIGLDKESNV